MASIGSTRRAAPVRWPQTLVMFCVLALLPAAARAEILQDAAPVVERYVAATGGRDALAAERTLHVKGRIESIGLAGRWEMWTMAPDRWMRRFTMGSLRFREGFDGTVAWRTDLSDKAVHLLSGAETTRAREEGWFLCDQWALDDQGGGSIRKRSTSYGSGDSYDVIEVTPPAGWASASWDGRTRNGGAPVGVYFLRFQAGTSQAVERFAIVR